MSKSKTDKLTQAMNSFNRQMDNGYRFWSQRDSYANGWIAGYEVAQRRSRRRPAKRRGK